MEPQDKNDTEKPQGQNASINTESEKQEEKEKKKSEDYRGQALSRVLRQIQKEEGPSVFRQFPRPTRIAGRFFGKGLGQGGTRIGIQGGRLAIQGTLAAGRLAISGGAALLSNPVGWIVIGVIIIIVIIVLIIVLFSGQGGPGGRQLWTVYCHDANGNSIMVENGNACAKSLAEFYTNEESVSVTAVCVDKCRYGARVYDKDPTFRRCSDDPSANTSQDGFCINYSPEDTTKRREYDCAIPEYYFKSGLYISSCTNVTIPTATPTP